MTPKPNEQVCAISVTGFYEYCPRKCPRVFMDYVTDEGETRYGEFDNTYNIFAGQCHLSEVPVGEIPEDQLTDFVSPLTLPEVIVPTGFATLELEPVTPPLIRSGGADLAIIIIGAIALMAVVLYFVEFFINKD